MVQVFDVTKDTDRSLYGPRPGSAVGLVLHSTDGRNSLGWLQGGSVRAGHPASSDALVDKRGNIFVIVPFDSHSWHAGNSINVFQHYSDRQNSIMLLGLEVECFDSQGEKWTYEQHVAAALYLRNKSAAHKFPLANCLAHYQIARPFGRRSDPAGITWGLFWSLVYNPTDSMLAFEKENQ